MRFYLGLIAGLMIAAGDASGDVNLVRNSGFEDTVSKWWSVPSCMSIKDGVGRNGSRGVHVRKTDLRADAWLWQKLIPAEPGRIYRFEAWIRFVDGLDKDPVYFIASCYNRSGRSLQRAEGRPLIYRKQVENKGWVKITGATARTPAGTRFIGVGCNLRPNCVGEVFIDDFRVVASEKRYVEHVYTSAYRDTAIDGKVAFSAPYVCDPSEYTFEELAPEFCFVDEKGKECRVSAERVGNDEAGDTSFSVSIDVGCMAMGRHDVKAVLRTRDGKVLDSANVSFTRVADQIPFKTWFDSKKRFLVDGKPFFPLGMYFGRKTKQMMDVYTQAAFNTVFCNAATQDLDIAHSYGLKAVVNMVPFVESKDLAGKLLGLKSHPAVIAWYTNDEMPPGLAPRQSELQKIYRSVDPDHPTFTVLDKPWHVRMFMSSFDVIGMDPYPIGNHRGGIDIAHEWARDCSIQCFRMRPMWQVPQAFNWKWYRRGRENPEFRFPTRDEFRSMTWQAIAAGANGLMYYSFASMWKEMKKKGEFEHHWAHVKSVVDEVSRYIPVIMSDGLSPNVRSSLDSIPLRTWRYEGATWILAVNQSRTMQNLTLSVDSRIADVSSAFGPQPELLKDGKIALSLGPLDCVLIVAKTDRDMRLACMRSRETRDSAECVGDFETASVAFEGKARQ